MTPTPCTETPTPFRHTFTFYGPWREVDCGGRMLLVTGAPPSGGNPALPIPHTYVVCELCGDGYSMHFVVNDLRQ